MIHIEVLHTPAQNKNNYSHKKKNLKKNTLFYDTD